MLCKLKTLLRCVAVQLRRGLYSWEWKEGEGRNPCALAGKMLIQLRPSHESNAFLKQKICFFFSYGKCIISILSIMLLKHCVGFGKCFKKQEKPSVNKSVMHCQPLTCAAESMKTQVRLRSWDTMRKKAALLRYFSI